MDDKHWTDEAARRIKDKDWAGQYVELREDHPEKSFAECEQIAIAMLIIEEYRKGCPGGEMDKALGNLVDAAEDVSMIIREKLLGSSLLKGEPIGNALLALEEAIRAANEVLP